MLTVAEVLADELVEAGVEVVFGLPGGENVVVLDAIRRRGIEFVLVKNESSACFMADVTARLTGHPGVALTTLGPGATNAYVGVAHAFLDRAPVLLVTAETEPHLVGTHTHQVLDLQACLRPVTKFSASLDEFTPRATIRHALLAMQTDRPGPAHLAVSSQTASRLALDAALPAPLPAARPPLGQAEVEAAASTLAASRRPLIVAGLGLEPEGAYAQLQRLAEALDAPVIDTPKCKGALAARHPLFAGTIGLTRVDPVYELLDEADCIVAVGFDVVELVKPWRQPQPLIWLANWRNLDPAIAAEHELVGPIAPALESLAHHGVNARDAAWGRAWVARFRQAQAGRPLSVPRSGRMLPQAVLSAVRDATPDDVPITTDVGSHKIFTALAWPALYPNRYFVSNGLSAMGFGITAAIAAARTTDGPVVCITGDAGAAMVCGELALATEMQLPVIVVIMNDEALDLIRTAQIRSGRTVYGTEFRNPDYAALATAFGLDYYRVHDEAGCRAAVETAWITRRPAILDALIDPVGYPTTVRTAQA